MLLRKAQDEAVDKTLAVQLMIREVVPTICSKKID